jgi:hypothetical protein
MFDRKSQFFSSLNSLANNIFKKRKGVGASSTKNSRIIGEFGAQNLKSSQIANKIVATTRPYRKFPHPNLVLKILSGEQQHSQGLHEETKP